MDILNTLMQKLFVRLYSNVATSVDRQRGASALEYIVLAAVIVGILVAVALFFAGDGENPFITFFQNLFETAGDQIPEG